MNAVLILKVYLTQKAHKYQQIYKIIKQKKDLNNFKKYQMMKTKHFMILFQKIHSQKKISSPKKIRKKQRRRKNKNKKIKHVANWQKI